VSLAAKRVSRNISNRNAVRLWNKADKYNSSSPKWNSVYDKGDAAYDKAVEKNKEIAKFKKEKGFQRGGDGTMMGEKFTKMGKLWSKYQSGGTKSTTKKYAKGGTKAKLGSGERFKALSTKIEKAYQKKGKSKSVAEKIGKATAAIIGMKKYGKAKMTKMAVKGRKGK
jgi:hypothetical protein